MKTIHLLLTLGSLLFATAAHAQWRTETYTLKGGWNAIFLHGDAKQSSIDILFPAQVTEVWRWNPNPNQVQFIESPLIPSAGAPEWNVWVRGGTANTLSSLIGQTAYLVKCTGTTANTYTVNIKQSPLPPSANWVRNGANLLGFPSSSGTFPTFSNYFATFPAAIAANTKVFKYIGGDLGPANPLQLFSPATEPLDRTKAYWFSSEVVGNFYAPLEISLSKAGGLAFGRTGSVITARIRNRTSAPVTLTLDAVTSEAAPASETDITGPVPLTRRTFNATSLLWEEAPITSHTETIGPQSTVELNFGIDRAAMTGSSSALYASFLKLTDSGNLMEVYLPATAQKASLAGLWVGDAQVSGVSSQVPGSPGTTTPSPFPLRILLHQPSSGAARLLSQVFLGQLAVAPNEFGICTRENLLKQDAKASAQRLVAAHLPLDQVITGSGTVAIGNSLTCNVTVPYNDRTNPFVHQYHPDHDNKKERAEPTDPLLPAGAESYNITRACTFNFTAAPPAGSTVTSGWGSSVIGGTYSETITGIHKEPIQLSGTFELRRASEIGTLSE